MPSHVQYLFPQCVPPLAETDSLLLTNLVTTKTLSMAMDVTQLARSKLATRVSQNLVFVLLFVGTGS